MASTINDFQNKVNRICGLGLVANNYNNEKSFNLKKDNLYKKTVTIDNTGNPARTNWLTRFLIDHRSLVGAGKSSFLFNDLRVYDSDGATPLQFYVQSANTSACIVFVRIPSIPNNSSKTIYIEYGNPALLSLSDTATIGSAFTKSTLLGRFMANEAMRRSGIANYWASDDSDYVWFWDNHLNTQHSVTREDPNDFTKIPKLFTNQISGLPVVRFDGSNDNLRQGIYPWLGDKMSDTTQVSIFAVVKASSQSNFKNFFTWTAGGSDYIANYWDGTNLKWILSNDGGVSGLNCGLTSGQFNISRMHWKQNTTNGFQTYANGSLVAQRNSTNTGITSSAQNLQIGGQTLGTTSYSTTDIAEILWFNDALNSTEQTEIETYLNVKYRVYSASSQPTNTVGSESSINKEFSYDDYSPFLSLLKYEKVDDFVGISNSEVKIKLFSQIEKTLVSGKKIELWSGNGTYDTISSITGQFSRNISASTTAKSDEVEFKKVEGADNLNDLTKFFAQNQLGNDYITSSDSDYISFDLNVGNASQIDLSNSKIEFYKPNTNLLSNPTNLTVAPWSGNQVVSSPATDPNGQNTAYKISPTVGATDAFLGQLMTVTASLTYTDEIWLRADSPCTIGLGTDSNGGPLLSFRNVNLTTEWQKFTATGTPSGTALRFLIGGYATFTASDGPIYAWSPNVFQGQTLNYSKTFSTLNLVNGLNICRFKKSEFTKTGSGTWADITRLKTTLKTSSSTQTVYHGNYKHVFNYNDSVFQSGLPLKLGQGVSSDNGSSWYLHTNTLAKIKGSEVSDDSYTYLLSDPINSISNLTWSDLPSFPSVFVAWTLAQDISNAYPSATYPAEKYYTFVVLKLLRFIFPDILLDVDLDIPTADSSGLKPQLDHFACRSIDKISDTLNALLVACGGYLYFDSINSKIVARNSYKTWDYQSSIYPTPYLVDGIVETHKDTQDIGDNLYNTINQNIFWAVQNRAYGSTGAMSLPHGNSDLGGIPIPTTSGNNRAVTFVDLSKLIQIQDGETSICTHQIQIGSYTVTTDPVNGTKTTNSSTCYPENAEVVGDKLLIRWINTSGSTKYLTELQGAADEVSWRFIPSSWPISQKNSLQNASSVKQIGTVSYPIDSRFSFHTIDISTNAITQPSIYSRLVDKFPNLKILEAEVIYDPNLTIGKVVKLTSRNNQYWEGVIISVDTDNLSTQKIKIMSVR